MDIFKLDYHLEIASCIFQPLFSYLCLLLQSMISLYFASRTLSQDQISGFGLATSVVYFTLLAISHGLNQALNLKVAQALGNNNKQLSLEYLNITVYAHIICSALVGVCLYLMLPLFSFLIVENPAAVIHHGRLFSVYVVMSTLIIVLYESMKLYFIANKIFSPFKYINSITLASHYLVCYILLIRYSLGLEGLGIAIIITQLLNVMMLKVYQSIYCKGLFDGFSFRLSFIESWPFVWEYLQQASLNMIHIFAGYFIFIFIQLLPFMLGNTQVHAQIALANTAGIFFRLVLCTSIAIQTFIGHEISKLEINKAKSYTMIALIQYQMTVLTLVALLWFFKKYWVALYTKNDLVAAELLDVLPYFIFSTFATDGYQEVMTGILKGLDKVKVVSFSTLLSYYVLGLPLMYMLAFNLKLGLAGIWLGFAFANIVLIFYYSYELYLTNWKTQAIQIIERIQVEKDLAEE